VDEIQRDAQERDGREVMPVIQAKKIPRSIASAEETLAKFCYYFQQYTYEQARKLPYKRVVQMLNAASKERASFFHEMVEITAAPHTKRGAGVNKLRKHYDRIINS
jgi:uncharacterized membrane protein YheB (UPF0754 family)